MVEIYYSCISKKHHTNLINNAITSFSNCFQNKIRNYHKWQDAQLSLLGRLLLYYALKRNNIDIDLNTVCYTPYGKPYLINKSMRFNISHSDNIVVCAVSKNSEIGIDIEKIKDINSDDFRSQMTALERYRVYDLNESFFTYWTQKEAVIKANGKGLSVPLKSFEIINNQAKIEDDIFYLKSVDLHKKYRCHVASKNETVELKRTPEFLSSLSLLF